MKNSSNQNPGSTFRKVLKVALKVVIFLFKAAVVIIGGFFVFLFSLLSGSEPHHGKCNGDCANCPPHYGYRYGRWYYGHGHIEGCEFGGNKGDGC